MHVTGSGRFSSNLREVIQEVNQMNPKPAFILNTGDLTEMGFEEDYTQYVKAISASKVPVYQVMSSSQILWEHIWGLQPLETA